MNYTILTIIISAVAVIISLISFVHNQNRKNSDDGQEYGVFVGEIKTNLKFIRDDIKEIKEDLSRSAKERDEAIEKAIKQHEGLYHK